MKKLTIYQQAQFAILSAFFLGLVVTGTLVIIQPECTDAVTSLFNEMKTLFLGLLSANTLREAIANSNGGSNEKIDSVVNGTSNP